MSTTTPRIAIAGMAIESSFYAAHRAGYRDFHTLDSHELLARYPFLEPGTPLREAADWIGIFDARSIPGGRVQRGVYEDFRSRIVTGIALAHAQEPLDAVYLDLHGAMGVEGLDDAEADLVRAVRDVVGHTPLISATMDLHGNVSTEFFELVDLPTCYRLAPHEDAWETRERSARTLLAQLATGTRPVRARVAVPILLPGEKTSTRVEPAKSLYASLAQIERLPGVLDASIWIGYAWADEPRCHAAVVVTGSEEAQVRRQAEALASELWRVREEFTFVGPPGTLEEGVASALAATERPYLISDSGDNPGAGGTGDVTWTLSRLLEMPELTAPEAPLTYVASIFDAAAVHSLDDVEPGAEVDITAGARVDDRVSPPVRIRGRLLGRYDGDPHAGRIVVIGVGVGVDVGVGSGGLRVVVTEFRKAFHDVADFAAIGLDPEVADILVTKIGYLEPTLYSLAAGWTLALTPGPVDQDLVRLGHDRIGSPMFPFDAFTHEPDLRAQVIS